MGVYLYGVNVPKEEAITIKLFPNGRATCVQGNIITNVLVTEIEPPHKALIETFDFSEYEVEDDDTGLIDISMKGLLDAMVHLRNTPILIMEEDDGCIY